MKYKVGDRVEYQREGKIKIGTITSLEEVYLYYYKDQDRYRYVIDDYSFCESKEKSDKLNEQHKDSPNIDYYIRFMVSQEEYPDIKKINKQKQAGGRPLKFKTVEELQEKIEEYKQWVIDHDKPLTIERLACFLECDRDTLLNYGKLEGREQFFGTIKKIKSFILADKVERLNSSDGNKAGVIFDLKNNHGFKDRTETEHSTPDGKPFQIERKNLSEKEIDARILELTQKFNQ